MLLLLLSCSGPSDAPLGGAPGDRWEPDFFDDTFVHEVAVTLSEEAVAALTVDPYTYVEGAVVVDGTPFERVGVRLRGKIGAFRDLTAKPKLKIDFNRYVPTQRLGALETLALNNAVVDCSYLREPVGYALFDEVGLPAPRTAFTAVTVNGADFGLYVAVEFPDDRFLHRVYADDSGNLYDGKYLYGERGDLTLVDFTPEQVGNFTLEEGVDEGLADLRAITDAVRAPGTVEERLGVLVDLDTLHRHLVAEQWVGQLDGYALNTNNYRVYVDPSDGRADLLAYDLDYAFSDAAAWGMSWAFPRGVLATACWMDAGCVTNHADIVRDTVDDIDTDALLARYDAWAALIDEAVAADPRRECSTRQIAAHQADVRAWVAGGSARLVDWWSW